MTDFLSLQAQLKDVSQADQLPPVDKWDPPFCGNMPLIIKSNGQWWHAGTPFTRAKLVQLFASVLKKEGDDYFLVTPVEKIGITVEDVPFIVVDSDDAQRGIEVTTQVGERFVLNDEHSVELRDFKHQKVPYVHVRNGLWARVHQNVLYRWVEGATESNSPSLTRLNLRSGNVSFCIGELPNE
ncbi:MAG: DUF1285 domain-containing protein [Pseudomonadota bacterium]